MVGALLHGARELAYRDERHVQLLRERLERPRYLRYLLLPRIGLRVALHQLPGLLQGLGAPAAVALGLGLVMIVIALPRLARAPAVEAGAGAVLVGLAASPHALNYEAALLLPALMWAVGATSSGLSEPARTRLVVAAYLLAPEYLVSETLGLSSLAVLTAAAVLIWISGWQRFQHSSEPAAGRATG